MEPDKLLEYYKNHKEPKLVKVTKKVYMSVMDYFREAYKSGSMYDIACCKRDLWVMEQEENKKRQYLKELKESGFFGGLFTKAPEPYNKDFKDGFAIGYMEATNKKRFLSNNLSKEKLEKLYKFLNEEGISITAVYNELLIQNSRELGEIVEYELVNEDEKVQV